MGTFGKIINNGKINIIVFYSDLFIYENQEEMLFEINSYEDQHTDVVKINADINVELCEALRIKYLPTIFVYYNGQMIKRESGAKTKEQLAEFMNT